MLNLIQVQERLRDMPMQAIMQYANGANPMIPPFLALGELNRRKKMQENAAAEQAKEMAGAPSIKEQIEQATGLMALQGARQRQAAQQQAGMQASMPMAAPNTMTSEPAQMATGGSVDDVMRRDYQRGGMAMSPDMMRKLAMLKAMKRPGVAGIPVQNMFKRSDYAGGGIVAFENGGSVFNRIDTSQTMRKKASQYRDALRELFGGADEFVDPADPTAMMGTRPSEGARSIAEIMDEQDEEKKRLAEIRRKAEEQQQIGRDIMSGKRSIPRRSDDAELMAERRPSGLASIARQARPEAFPATVVPRDQGAAPQGLASLTRPDMTMEQRLEEVRRLNKLAGRDPNFMSEYEKRIADIEARRVKERESEPMDKLTSFLAGVAQSRRGAKFGEAGAAGVSASMKLAAEQKALRDRQEMDMAQLRLSVAREKDALAKGDLDAARAEQREQDKLKLDLFKAQSEDQYRKDQIKSQQARLSFDQQQSNQMRQMDMVRKYLDDWKSANGKSPKYLTRPEQLDIDAMNAAREFFGADRLEKLGLGAGTPVRQATGNRPPLSAFNK